MRGVAFLLWLVASCAPDYGRTAFLCKDDGGCPSGQTCISGRCRRSDPIGNGSGDGVICGGRMCALTEQCCIDGSDRPRCADAALSCPGVSALCDGTEDCGGNDRCCADSDAVTCAASCKHYACRDREDCPLAEPNCCDATAQQWGECSDLDC